jgi:hypothetical protein
VDARPARRQGRAYLERQLAALAIAREEGVLYAHGKNRDPILCHNCGGVLLRFDETSSKSWAASCRPFRSVFHAKVFLPVVDA